MISIDDYDLPITAAQKLITGTRPDEPTPVMKALRSMSDAINGTNTAESNIADMFTIDELKEIADYLMIYYEAHKDND